MFSHFLFGAFRSAISPASSTSDSDVESLSSASSTESNSDSNNTNELILPEVRDRNNLEPLRNNSQRLQIHNYTPTPQRIYIDELEEIVPEKNSRIGDLRLKLLQDFLDEISGILSRSMIDTDLIRQKQLELINLIREIKKFTFCNENVKKDNALILNQMLDVAKDIFKHPPSEVSGLRSKITAIRNSIPRLLTASENVDTKKRRFEESKLSENKFSTNIEKNSGLGLFSSKKQSVNTPLLLAIEKGESEEIEKLVGGDTTICCKLVPDNSFNTYFKYALNYNNNTAKVIAALLPAEAVSAKSLQQLLAKNNKNNRGETAFDVARKNNNIDALKNGIALAIVKANKGSGLYKSIEDMFAQQLSNSAVISIR